MWDITDFCHVSPNNRHLSAPALLVFGFAVSCTTKIVSRSVQRCTTDPLFAQLVDFNSLSSVDANSSRGGDVYSCTSSLVCSSCLPLFTISHFVGGEGAGVPAERLVLNFRASLSTAVSVLPCFLAGKPLLRELPILVPENTCSVKSG